MRLYLDKGHCLVMDNYYKRFNLLINLLINFLYIKKKN